MNLENEVVSLELAKKLLTLGVKQDSLFVWEFYDDKCFGVKFIPYAVVPDQMNNFKIYSAFTVGELMELLPAFIDTKMNEPFNIFWLSIKKRSAKNIQYIARYVCDSIPGNALDNPFYEITHPHINAHAEKLSDCLALMLISLIEDGQ